MSHTSGPWILESGGPESNNSFYVLTEAGFATDKPWIATVQGTHVGEKDEAINEANARLIAAAPDMLEALTECEEYFAQRADADHNGNDYVGNAAMDMLMVVRAALAKATEATNGR